jgi:hypothetical protein
VTRSNQACSRRSRSAGHLAGVLRHHGAETVLHRRRQLARVHGLHPLHLRLSGAPEHVVPAHLNAVLLRQLQHGYWEPVVLVVWAQLRAVPLHLVLEGGYGEPRREPLLVCRIVQDLPGHCVAEREAVFRERDVQHGIRKRLPSGGFLGDDYLDGALARSVGGQGAMRVPLFDRTRRAAGRRYPS